MDYLRDRESLYDIFPAMTEETFQALQCILDPNPERRDLLAFRARLLAITEWTSNDVADDDFALAAPGSDVVTKADRTPLRTPSLQAAASKNLSSFSWASALDHYLASPPPTADKALFTIVDDEDGIPINHAGTSSKMLPSVDSGIGASLASMKVRDRSSGSSNGKCERSKDGLTSTAINASSLPGVNVQKWFKNKDRSHMHFAKSWSDWVEEEEEAANNKDDFSDEIQSTSSHSNPLASSTSNVREERADWMPHWDE